MNRYILIYLKYSLNLACGWVPGMHPSWDPPACTTPGTPASTVLAASAVPAAAALVSLGRGALIRRPTHFKA